MITESINPITKDITSLSPTTTTNSGPSQTANIAPDSSPMARTLDEFIRPAHNDPGELIKHRFLCRNGGLLLVGPTGHGKSSLAMQFMIKWALGQSVFGLEPARPLTSLLIQAENDDADLAEMKCGVFNGLQLSEQDQKTASSRVYVSQECSKAGKELCEQVIEPLLKEIKPDLLWIDPALAYIGGDMNSQKDVGIFLRNYLAPLIAKYNCGVIIIHHTNKISRDPEKQTTDYTYLGAGSAEWSNWSRAIIALNKTDVDNLYELIAAKRGARLRWRTEDGETLTMKRYIGHSRQRDTICWVEMAITDAQELRANNGKSPEDILKHVPQNAMIAKNDLIAVCQQNGIGKNLFPKLMDELLEDGQLYEIQVPRPNKRAKVLVSRHAVEIGPEVILDSLGRNNQGHYFPPAPPKPQAKKEL